MKRAIAALYAFVGILTVSAQVRHYTVHDGLATGYVWQIIELPNGQMLVNSEGTFELFNGQHFVPVPCDALRCYRLPDFGEHAHLLQGDSLLWLSDYYNVYLFDVRQGCFRYDIEARTKELKEFLKAKKDYEIMSDEPYTSLMHQYDIQARLGTACHDRQGGTWIGTIGQGLYYIPPLHPMAETIPLPNKKGAMAIAKCDEGLVVCTEDGILLFNAVTHSFSTITKEQNALYYNAATDNEGRVWLCSRNGLYKYHHGNVELYDANNVKGLIHSQTRFARMLPDGRLLIANHLHYLGYLDTDSHEFSPLNAKLPQLEQYRTMVDGCLLPHSPHVAILTQNGIECLDYQQDSLSDYKLLPTGLSQKFNCIYVDSKQRVWLGAQNGLAQQGRIWLDACILGITEDQEGYLWVTTSKGISRITPTDNGVSTLDYNADDGIPEEGLQDRGILTADDGTIYLCCTKGLIRFKPTQFTGRQQAMPTRFVGLSVCGQALPANDFPLSVAYNENYLTIQFSTLNYACPQRTMYRYRLNGIDETWLVSHTGNGLGTAGYNALPPGQYVFEVQASINNGEWGPLAQKAITVHPPLWLTWWAKLLYGGVLATIIVYLIKLYIRKKRIKLERENDARINHLFELREEARHQFAKNVNIRPENISINKEEEELVTRLMKAIELHMDDCDYTVDQLAADVAQSRSNLYRKMQQMLGITPNDFLRNVRLKRAAQLMAETHIPVNQVSMMVGFKTTRYFSQYFKSMFGVLPSEYRNPKKTE